MSRQSSYLLFFWLASTILVRGSLQTILKRSCPSCSQDCPEALTVQLPWDTRRGANLQSDEQSLPVNSLRNSFHSTQEELIKNAARDRNLLSDQYPPAFGNHRSFLRREPASEDLSFTDHLNTFPKYMNKRTSYSQNKPTSGYPRVLPARQISDIAKNTLFTNLRNKVPVSLQNRRSEVPIFYAIGEKTPASKLPVSYRVDRNVERPLWNNLRGASNILLQKFYPRDASTFRYRREDEEKNAMKESTSRSQNSLQPPVIYNPTKFNLAEAKRDNYNISPKDLNIQPPIKDILLRNWDIIKDTIESSRRAQQKSNLAKTDFSSEVYPDEKEDETVVSKIDNDQIKYNPYALLPDVRISNPSKNEESFDWKMIASKNSQGSTEIERSEANENNWPPMYPTTEKNIGHLEDEIDEKSEHLVDEDEFYRQLFENENKKSDAITIEQDYDPYIIYNMNNWNRITDKDLSDMSDFSSSDLQGLQEARKLYPEEDNSELLRDDEDVILEDKTYPSTIIRPSVINANNAYNTPKHTFSVNTLNNANYPVKSLGMREASENKDNILYANFAGNKNDGVYEDKTMMQNNMRVEDSISLKNNLNSEKYSVIDTQSAKSNAQDETFTRFDPDLLDDVENPPTESIKSLAKSSEEFSTSRQQ
ncbi:protein PFC0760c-like [Pseudomyrmex gracilis]|uniref:protein PFC0760c-like n=1 Tax=Pseudomyrmex gracilis TaxID=219809 RepID=UPI000994E50D|nr:protein PFC0760c-like [Pseudomyrmex gracilis]